VSFIVCRQWDRQLLSIVAVVGILLPHAADAGTFEPPRMKLPADGFGECRAIAKSGSPVPEQVSATVWIRGTGEMDTFGLSIPPTTVVQKLVRCALRKVDFKAAAHGGYPMEYKASVDVTLGPVNADRPDSVRYITGGADDDRPRLDPSSWQFAGLLSGGRPHRGCL
jgi:hypothetical protein